jgi:hypothetical protein
MTLVVRRQIHSSSGKFRYVKHASREFSRHFTADGISFSHLAVNCVKNSMAFFLEVA